MTTTGVLDGGAGFVGAGVVGAGFVGVGFVGVGVGVGAGVGAGTAGEEDGSGVGVAVGVAAVGSGLPPIGGSSTLRPSWAYAGTPRTPSVSERARAATRVPRDIT